MSFKTEYIARPTRKSAARRRENRQCVPVVARLEDRAFLSSVGALAASGVHQPILNAVPQTAEVHFIRIQVAREEALAARRDARVIHFPGGSVTIGRGGTRVHFPGGSVHANRHGTVVTFPGGYVIAGFGHTIVRFPGGFIDI
jgi:L-aminopeptidase/D-esterase-like protein